MKCPKCNNVQEDNQICQVCGLVFEKYRRYLEHRAAQQQASQAQVKAPASGRKVVPILLGIVVLLAGVVGGGYYLGYGKALATYLSPAKAAPLTTARPEVVAGNDIVALLDKNAPAGNPIESARNATVFIKTPWGLGSGFFVNKDCTIVSNRHVVQLDDETIAEIEADIAEMKREAARMEAVVDNDSAKLQKYYARNQGPAAAQKAEVFKQELEAEEEILFEMKAQIEKAETEFAKLSGSVKLQVILADGSEFSGFVDRVSDRYDLAIVKLDDGGSCPVIPIGASDDLHQGDRLYTVGSPMGVRHTVTSGIYSGRYELEGISMLQTDAPINPGNSGGPLLNADGRVLGVNTLVMNNAQGIGFAIPIEKTLQTFPVN